MDHEIVPSWFVGFPGFCLVAATGRQTCDVVELIVD